LSAQADFFDAAILRLYAWQMKSLAEFHPAAPIRVLFTDIDDTLTTDGQLGADAYASLWDLRAAGIRVVPVTGRPAGWCEMIARFWPVAGIVGENGGFYFRYADKKMRRVFLQESEPARAANRARLGAIRDEVLREVPACAIASDQFCRMLDLAVDFAEDVGPLPEKDVERIVAIFERHGAQAKVSSIHVNGWFGDYDKLGMCKRFAREALALSLDKPEDRAACAFSGDSPNDEPMFGFFENSLAVANIRKFAGRIRQPPKFVAAQDGGAGFVEIARALIQSRSQAHG
jgi:HAD superfamily hydrolase (TIGR01484 family)